MTLPKAFRDEVVVKVIYSYNKDGGKIIVPDTGTSIYKYHSDYKGEVIDIGPDYPYDLKKGDMIMFQRHEGKPICVGDQEYRVLKERWVMGVYNEI